ncbi:hypothetical protein K491DRAFT_311414 [Lophiostoma macrostomum CBS 122681]|uniref:Flavin reductase like domain-containing protein n=1 Tax=Lophiostoma macrostomum CBS 122681 TaxID=1314788 RepID=A0A6A6TFW6_9PLEO|nr:hypothetical protein K491DRAFT_311414 [Lophiostoma macrostomum CBS 122681]
MAASQRQASRFFAAFYKWDRWTAGPRYCSHVNRPRILGSNVSATRSISLTPRWREQDGTDAQPPRDQEAEGSSVELPEEPPQKPPQEASAEPHAEPSAETSPWLIDRTADDYPRTPGFGTTKEDTEADQTAKLTDGHSVGQSADDQTQDALKESVRKLMRKVPHPVVVLTAAGVGQTGKPVPLGVAVSSFTTVTLNPPMISFNLKQPSRTLDAIRADNGRFRVHFLPSSLEAAKVVDSFTRGNTPASYVERRKYATIHATNKAESKPAELRRPYVMAAMQCEIVQEVAVADHVIAVAKVSSLSDLHNPEPALLYADGAYISQDFEKIHPRLLKLGEGDASTLVAAKDMAFLKDSQRWYISLFLRLGDEDRYGSFIRTFIENHPELLKLPPPEAESQIVSRLQVTPDALGWCIQGLVEEAAAKAKLKATGERQETTLPAKLNFHGSLTPDHIVGIIERAKAFVRADSLVLSLFYTDFLRLLGVSSRPYGLLMRDILEALRSENLAPPFDPRKNIARLSLTIEDVERIEYKLSDYLRVNAHAELLETSTDDLCKAIQCQTGARAWIRCVRNRLQAEIFPEKLDEAGVDLVGELAKQEVKIALHRIVSHMRSVEKEVTAQESSWVIFQKCRIHPLVSGFDPHFLIEKLRQWRRQYPNPKYQRLVSALYNESLRYSLGQSRLEHEVQALVTELPMRAITLDRSEVLVALGLSPEATTPNHKFRLDESLHIPALLCWAFKKHYVMYPAEERAAIDKFLAQNDTPELRQWIEEMSRGDSDFAKYHNEVSDGSEPEVERLRGLRRSLRVKLEKRGWVSSAANKLVDEELNDAADDG